MVEQFTAIVQILALFLFMAAAYFGLGKVASQIWGITKPTPLSAVMSIWLGWAFSLFILQIAHLFVPITAYVVVPLFTAGVILSIRQIILSSHRSPVNNETGFWVFSIITISIIAVWAGFRSMLTPIVYDAGLYHFSSIRWINTFPIVPGLGNLHARLAFNQSFFTYVAALNFHPFFGYGRSLANSFLLLLTVATTLDTLRPLFQRPSLLTESHPYQYASGLFALPLLVFFMITSDGLASPTPDAASVFLQIAMFVILAPRIMGWIHGEKQQDHQSVVLAVLASTAVTVKLSNAAFSAVIFGFCLVHAWRSPHSRIRGICRIFLPCAAVVLVWCYRGFILSGAPLYPSTIGYIPVDWAIPIEEVQGMANTIYAFARRPGVYWGNVLGNWEWLGPWSMNISKNRIGVVYPLLLSVFFCTVALIWSAVAFLKKRRRPRYLDLYILLPTYGNLIYWFFTAPELRFAQALFWMLSLSSSLLVLATIQPFLRKRSFIAALCIVFILANLFFAAHIFKNFSALRDVSLSGWHPVPAARLIQKQTSSGLVVSTPEIGDKCWDCPLPCTPYFNPDLRLRIPGKLESGFTVQKSRENTGKGNSAEKDSTALHPHQ